MCINSRLVYNKYINQAVRCDCGKCPTCLQSKASYRATRIRNNVSSGHTCLFVTLTYDNRFVPYVHRDDFIRMEKYPVVYRDYKVHRKRQGSSYLFRDSVEYDPHSLCGDFVVDYGDYFNPFKLKGLKHLPNRIGVCYYEDVKDFIKRVR